MEYHLLKIIKNTTVFSLIFALLFTTSYLPIVENPFSPQKADASNTCSANGSKYANAYSRVKSRVGGVSLDQAAKFLADMSDITGAYYDSNLDRIVFIGKKQVGAPKFEKDDLAVAIKSVIFDKTIPGVDMNNNVPNDGEMNIVLTKGLEDTRFGNVLIDADWKLKLYIHGEDQNDNAVTSSVSSYKSFYTRLSEKGPLTTGGATKFWITPKEVTLKKDDSVNAFVFNSAIMEVKTAPETPNNDPKIDQAAAEFAADQTANYDAYAQETAAYYEVKQLAKLVSVIKWIDDAGIATDFQWARDYAPKKVATPRTVPEFSVSFPNFGATGGMNFYTGNTYTSDNGSAASLKASSQSVSNSKEDLHWSFTNGGQQYEAVAVTADAFQSMGSYNRSETDMSFPTAGDLTMALQRSYSSFSGGQKGLGRGWSFMPVSLYDNNPTADTFTCANGSYPKSLAFITQDGGFESFTINDCNVGYVPDDGAYNSKVIRNSDGTFIVRLKDLTEFKFGSSYKLDQMKDKNGNAITYNYDSSGRLVNLTDGKGHQITVNYGNDNLISSISDWSGRSTTYTYDSNANLTSVKDPNNNSTTYTYDTDGKLTVITDKNNEVEETNTYTENGTLATQKDSANVTNTFSYDKVNKKLTIADNQTPARNQIISYDSKGRVLEEKDPQNNTVQYTYGVETAPLTIKDKKGNIITNTYDTNGNLTSVIYPDNKKVSYEYNTSNRITKIIDERYGLPGKETIFTYDSIGNLTQLNDGGQIAKYTYDTAGDVLTLTDPLNQIVTWTRDSFGNKLTEKDALNNITTYEYDAIGRVKKTSDPDGRIFSQTYDNNDNVITLVSAAGTTTNVYDKEDRLVKITQPNNAVTEYSYNNSDSLINVKDAVVNDTTYGYDAYQNLLTQQDALDNMTTHIYDSLNRVLQSTTQLGKVSKWEYDANGNITKRTDANNNATNYIYDVLNRLTKITYPNAQTVTFEYDNRGNRTKMIDSIGTSTYTYDNFDRLTQAKDAFNQIISYTYNNSNMLTKITYPDNKAVNYTYDSNDRLSKVTDWNLRAKSYTYNKNGTIATKTLPNSIVTSYTYDAANRLIGVKHMKSTTTVANFVYERDSVGNITKASENGTYVLQPSSIPTPTPTGAPTPTPTTSPNGQPDIIITNLTTAPANPAAFDMFTITVSVKNQGTAAVNGQLLKFGYYYDLPQTPTYQTTFNDFDNLSVSLLPGETKQYSFPYAMFYSSGAHTVRALVDQQNTLVESDENNNAAGPTTVNIASIGPVNEFLAGTGIRSLSDIFTVKSADAQVSPYVTNFTYDPLGRLTSVQYPDNSSFAYTYDGAGNRLTETKNGVVKNYTYDTDNKLSQGGELTYFYDESGNQTMKTQTALLHNHKYTYDFENRITKYIMPNNNTHNFKYDGMGNRLEKEFATAISKWTYDTSGELSRLMVGPGSNKYIWGIDLISQGGDTSSSRQYPLEDALGNIRFITDSSGNRVKAYEYEVYGKVRRDSGSSSSVFQFQGQQFDGTLDMYNLRARDYDQDTGRFITKDPVKGSFTAPMSQNPYQYGFNNPVINSDPSGLDAIIYTNPLASIWFVGGHTGLYFQDNQGAWYKSDLSIDSSKQDNFLDYSGQGKYEINKLPSDFDPASVTKFFGLINNKYATYYKTTKEQDANMSAYINAKANNINNGREDYNLFTNNCKIASYNALQNSGVATFDVDFQPSPMVRFFFSEILR